MIVAAQLLLLCTALLSAFHTRAAALADAIEEDLIVVNSTVHKLDRYLSGRFNGDLPVFVKTVHEYSVQVQKSGDQTTLDVDKAPHPLKQAPLYLSLVLEWHSSAVNICNLMSNSTLPEFRADHDGIRKSLNGVFDSLAAGSPPPYDASFRQAKASYKSLCTGKPVTDPDWL